MPTSIPYDHPSFVLGHLIDTNLLQFFQKIEAQHSKINAAQDKMNGLLTMRRSLAMTINELADLEINIDNLKTEIEALNQQITTAAQNYLSIRVAGEATIQKIRTQIADSPITEQLESPVDYSLSNITSFPIASESIKLDSQYFSYEGRAEDDLMAGIESYIKEATSNIGSNSAELGKTTTAQIRQQKLNHTLSGTLIITASCTHANARLIEPCYIDVEKTLQAWNAYFPEDQLTEAYLSSTTNANLPTSKNQLTFISGMTLGSSFIGMVHFLKKEESNLGPVNAIANGLKEKLELGGWLENTKGGYGIAPEIQEEINKIINDNMVSCHVNLITLGALPSISSNQVAEGTRQILQKNTVKETLNLVEQKQDSEEKKTVASSANAARTGQQILKIQEAKTKSLIEGLANIKHTENQTIDVNSLLEAFKNYLELIKTKESNCGFPIDFHLKKISKTQLIKAWKNKYHPNNNTIQKNKK